MLRFGHCHFHEKEGQKRKHDALNEPDEYFKHHKGCGKNERHEEREHGNEYTPGKDITKETEGKGDEADEFGNELDDADKETHEGVQIDEAPEVAEAKAPHAGDLDHDESNDRKRDRRIQVGIKRTKERHCLRAPVHDNTFHAWDKFKKIRKENEKDERHEEREEFLGSLFVVVEVLDDEGAIAVEHRLDCQLKFAWAERDAALYNKGKAGDDEEYRHAHHKRIGDRHTHPIGKLFCCN